MPKPKSLAERIRRLIDSGVRPDVATLQHRTGASRRQVRKALNLLGYA